MKYFIEEGNGKKVIIRLDAGDMLLESIEQVIKEADIKNGVVVSGIGTLSDTRIHMVTTVSYPAVEIYPRMERCSDGIKQYFWNYCRLYASFTYSFFQS